MATITITIPDNKLDAVVNGFAKQYKYQSQVEDSENPGQTIDNPTSKNEFAKNIIKSFVQEVYVASEVSDLDATRQNTITTAKAEVDGVTVA